MAMIDCPECGKKVSDKATTCIGCGVPLMQETQQQSIQQNQAPQTMQQPPTSIQQMQPDTNAKTGKKCPKCSTILSKKAKTCPQCGSKIKKSIFKRWWFWVVVIIGVVVIVSISNSGNSSSPAAPPAPSSVATPQPVLITTPELDSESINEDLLTQIPTESSEEVPSEVAPEPIDDVVRFGDGTYLVGTDIKPGLYRVILKDTFLNMGYVERSKGLSMELSDILANIILTGDGYVEVKDTDAAVKLTGVEIYEINLDELTQNIKTEVSDGIYLVGFDIEPGTYKVEVTDTTTGMAYVERTNTVAMDISDIIANEIFQGQGYLEVKESDFAIRIQGANLIKQ